jgi:hypothetical protein
MLAHLACEPGVPPEQPTEGAGLGVQQKALSEQALAENEVVCNGNSVNLLSSATNCGRCGLACPQEATCSNAVCECPAFHVICAGRCAFVAEDEEHCGRCGRACPAGAVCEHGTCIEQ